MSSTPQQPVTLRTDDSGPIDPEISNLASEASAGRLDPLRGYLSRTRASADWQDRIHVLERVSPKVSIDALDTACEAEPRAADLLLIRCAYYADLAKTMRGTGTANQVSGARFQNSAACIKAALSDMTTSTELDTADPTACTLTLKPLTIFSQTDLQQKFFAKAIAIAPDLVPAHFAVISAKSERWGGSHQACLSFAREAITHATPGSDMAACLFWAHTLVRSHYVHFDKNMQAARRYALNPAVTGELNTALDAWLTPSFSPRRSSIPFLQKASEWYRAVMNQDRMNQDRLNRVIAFTGEPADLLPATRTAPSRTGSSPKSSGGLLAWLFGSK
jgi:hypothetical protein